MLRIDDTPDEYVADLLSLLLLSGHADGEIDAIVIEQLIVRLAKEFSKDVRTAFAGKKKTVSGCLELIRGLRAERGARLTHTPDGCCCYQFVVKKLDGLVFPLWEAWPHSTPLT